MQTLSAASAGTHDKVPVANRRTAARQKPKANIATDSEVTMPGRAARFTYDELHSFYDAFGFAILANKVQRRRVSDTWSK